MDNLSKRERLLVESQMNGSVKPFHPQCFNSYNEAFSVSIHHHYQSKGLGAQGIKAFYKGNLVNLVNLSLDNILKFQIIKLFRGYKDYDWKQ